MTLDCLRILYAEMADISADVWVVDNASTDGSPEAIREAFPDVELIINTDNKGFGAANNQAMAQARGKYFLLLNSDAFIMAGAINILLRYMEQHCSVGVVAPRLLNKDGSLQVSCFPFPSPARAWLENLWLSSLFANHPVLGDYRRWPHNSERIVASVIGACMLVRRETYAEVGGFDERFFMYSEETDWQKRMRGAGWQIAITPEAQVTHFGGGSGATERARINRHFFDSLDYYERKHHGFVGLLALRAGMALGCFLRLIGWTIIVAFVTRRRTVALSKVRLYCWLIVRQLTYWPRCV